MHESTPAVGQFSPANKQGRPGRRRPIAVDLFSGAGGLSLGFEQAGFDILTSVEYDPIHAAVHSYNFPKTTTICADISDLSAAKIKAGIKKGWRTHGRSGSWDGEVDVVIGGPPCQGFSLIGKRQFDDVRNQLVFNFARVVGELKPRYFVMENVPGMASLLSSAEADAPLLLDLLVSEFKGLGYGVLEPKVLNACEFGVPQDRRRLIMLGAREGLPLPSYPKAITRPIMRRPTLLPADDGPDLPLCPNVREAIGDLPDVEHYPGLRDADEVALDPKVTEELESQASVYVRILRELEENPDDRSRPREWDLDLLTSSRRTIHTSEVTKRFSNVLPGSIESVSRLFRLHPEGVSPTLRAGTHYERGSFNAARPIHPKYPRVISVREAARLHSFPDWFRLHRTKWHGFRQIGNSLPPRVGQAVGVEICRALNVVPSRVSKTIDLTNTSLLALTTLEAAEYFEADLSRIPRSELRTRPSQLEAAKVAA